MAYAHMFVAHLVLFLSILVCDLTIKCTRHGLLQLKPMLLGLFKNINGRVSDSPKVVHFWRIRYGCGIRSEDSTQLRLKDLENIYMFRDP